MSPRPFLQELNARVAEFAREDGRPRYLIAEDHSDDPRVITPGEQQGLGFDAVWCDDFHHSLHTLLTGEDTGYYADYGEISHLVKCYREGFVYTGEYSHWLRRRHGRSSADCRPEQFVVYAQNHDQVGNRLSSERLCNHVSFEAAKLAAGAMLCSPYIPLLFMGEEFAASTPFPFFVDHSDPGLKEAVRNGREREFARFAWRGAPPDPGSEETFRSAVIRWEERAQGHHAVMLRYYQSLLALRRNHAALGVTERSSLEINGDNEKRVIWMVRRAEGERLLVAMNFSAAEISITPPLTEVSWRVLLDSAAAEWNGPGTLFSALSGGNWLRLRPYSIALFAVE
jgi:maltooligosyltrehalose trehalohydrolase